jgi:hypothetical protein
MGQEARAAGSQEECELSGGTFDRSQGEVTCTTHVGNSDNSQTVETSGQGNSDNKSECSGLGNGKSTAQSHKLRGPCLLSPGVRGAVIRRGCA